MEYRPLNQNASEIRLLTILSEGDDLQQSTAPVRCILEHVSIDPQYRSDAFAAGQSTRGSTGVWPSEVAKDIELGSQPHQIPDSSILWRSKAEPPRSQQSRPDNFARYLERVVTSAVRASNTTDTAGNDSNNHLSWRYTWGDYVALSYVWGDASCTHEIFVNGFSVQVTRNLDDALRQLRTCHRIKQGFKVWVDAICINQNDLGERSMQVGRMASIYELAWHVVVWLGAEADDSDMAMIAVRYLSSCMRQPEPLRDFYRQSMTIDMRPLFIVWSTYKRRMRQAVYRSLYHLLNRSYWRRLWILQEIAFGRPNTPILCGRRCVLWQDLCDAASFIHLDRYRFGRDIIDSVRPKSIASFSWDFTSDRLRNRDKAGASSEGLWELSRAIMSMQTAQHKLCVELPLDTIKAFQLSHNAKVTNPKDKVYGILGIASVAALVKLVPNYSHTTAQVFAHFSRSLFASGDLNGLRFVEAPMAKLSRKRQAVAESCPHGLASWVICWTCPQSPTARLLGRYTVCGEARGSPSWSSSGQVLTTPGIVFDTVNGISALSGSGSDPAYPLDGRVCQSIYGDVASTREALWRTIVGDITREGEWAPETYSWVL